MEGHKISESNRAAVELCVLSEAGAFVRNMDPMKKEKKERVFFDKYLSITDNIEDDQFENTGIPVRDIMRRIYKGAKKDNTPKSLWRKYKAELTCLRTCQKNSRNWQLGGAAEWIHATPPHEDAIGAEALEREVSGKISLLFELCPHYYSPPIRCVYCTARTKKTLPISVFELSSGKNTMLDDDDDVDE
jgi:hypothetical protein